MIHELGGKTAVITGAASGIGRALALELASQGVHLALADISESGLAQTVAAVHAAGGKASSHRVDVASREAVEEFATAAVRIHGAVQIVINNAGVALSSVSVQDLAYADLEWILGVNMWGVVHGSKAFLPHLLQQPHANLVNVSSIFGVTAAGRSAAYSMSKFAVRGFSEALRQELRGSPVALTVVFPGGVRTAIARNVRPATNGDAVADPEAAIHRFETTARTSAQAAATCIVDAIRRDAPRVVIGGDAKFLDLLARLRPAGYDRFMLRHVVAAASGTRTARS